MESVLTACDEHGAGQRRAPQVTKAEMSGCSITGHVVTKCTNISEQHLEKNSVLEICDRRAADIFPTLQVFLYTFVILLHLQMWLVPKKRQDNQALFCCTFLLQKTVSLHQSFLSKILPQHLSSQFVTVALEKYLFLYKILCRCESSCISKRKKHHFFF